MRYLDFLRDNSRWLAAGAVLTLSSSFGQTFFISIYAGEIRAEFDLTHGQWGGIYTIGTLASALCMIFAGGLTDRFKVRTLAPIVFLVFCGVCLAMAAVPNVWLLPLVIFGLRLCGQGMLTHTAMVGLGRWFRASRGQANAIFSMGYISGEALLPFVFVVLIGAVGWRGSWVIAAGLILVFIPVIKILLSQERTPVGMSEQTSQTGMDDRHWTRKDAVTHWLFWIAALGVVSPSMLNTAYFFQQVHLTELKGWNLGHFVALIPIYSLVSFCSTFVFGALADRFGTGRVFSVAMIPPIFGYVIVSMGETLWAAAFGFVLMGIMQGATSTVGGAFWPEYFGTRHLGSVRAVGVSLMVLGSALGPGITGFLIDFGVDYRTQLLGMSVYYAILTVVLIIGFQRAQIHFQHRCD